MLIGNIIKNFIIIFIVFARLDHYVDICYHHEHDTKKQASFLCFLSLNKKLFTKNKLIFPTLFLPGKFFVTLGFKSKGLKGL